MQDKLIEKLKIALTNTFKEINEHKESALDFYHSEKFKLFILRMEKLEPNTSIPYSDLIEIYNFNKEEIDHFINLLKYELTPEFLFYSETANLDDISQGFFFNYINDISEVSKSNLQIYVEFFDKQNMIIFKKLDLDKKIIKVNRILSFDLFRLDRLTTSDNKTINLLNGDSDEFINYAKKTIK